MNQTATPTRRKRPKSYFILILLLVFLSGTFLSHRYASAPFGSGGIFRISEGQSLNSIAKELKRQGFLKSEIYFKILIKLQPKHRQIHFGSYRIPAKQKPSQILAILSSGKTLKKKMTIPEGFRFEQIIKRMEASGMGSYDELLKLFNDTQLIAKLTQDTDLKSSDLTNLEGYLFPSTYHYDEGTQPRQLLAQMIQQFRKKILSEIQAQDSSIDATIKLTSHEIVTLASIIEKETAAPEERRRIAGVFYNRLRLGMKLQTDPTVIYGIKNFDGNITRKHLKTPHPYNTYTQLGLPPGPIASPGLASVQAVLDPEKHDYLYFVARGKGRHHFSKSLKEHNQAVRKYILRK